MNRTNSLITTRIKISIALFSMLILGAQQATAITIYTGTPFKVYYGSNNIVGPCTASGAWTGPKQENITNFTQFTGSSFTTGTYRFNFDCTDGNGKVANNFTDLTVIPSVVSLAFTTIGSPNPYIEPPLNSNFRADPYDTLYQKQGNAPGHLSTNLRWNFTDVQGTCKASGYWATALPGKLASSGVYLLKMTPGKNYDHDENYTLTCTSSRGTVVSSSITIFYECRNSATC